MSTIDEVVARLQEAATAKKCWSCGCLHESLRAIEDAFPEGKRPLDLREAIRVVREHLTAAEYDCLGCAVCYPAIAMNALDSKTDVCLLGGLDEEVDKRDGWPPLPGDYTVLRYHAPVAVCTLTDDELARQIASGAALDVAIVGTLQTENLGIERLICNALANPNIRFLVVCGPDSRQTIPGAIPRGAGL